MLTYLIYPDWYWSSPYLYWPKIIVPEVPYECETAVWIEDEDLDQTGNEYFRTPDTAPTPDSDSNGPFSLFIPAELLAATGNTVTSVDVPFAVHEELAATGNTYIRVEDTAPVADQDSPTYFGLWKKKGHS